MKLELNVEQLELVIEAMELQSDELDARLRQADADMDAENYILQLEEEADMNDNLRAYMRALLESV